MARPTKQGIDYFPMDCVPDSSLELFIAENGAAGFGLLAMIWQRIYRDDGYFIRNDDDLVLRLRRDSLLDMESTVSIIGNAIKRGLFDKDMHERFGILTSRGIQRRYFNGAKQKKQAKIYADFCLIDIKEYGNAVSINGNPDSIDGNTTKVKVEVKEKVKGKEEGESAKRGSKSDEPKPSKPSPLKNPGFSVEFVEKAWPFYLKVGRGKYKNQESQEVALRQLYKWAGGDEREAVEALAYAVANSYQGLKWYFEHKSQGRLNNVNGTTVEEFGELLGWIKTNPGLRRESG